MDACEYIELRLDDQVDWYDKKSRAAQKALKWYRRSEIVAAAAIPFLAGFSEKCWVVPFAIGLLGVVVVVLAAFQSLGQYHENWLEYRTACESLKHEKFLFLTRCEPYDSESSYSLLVERVERLVSKENSIWAQNARAGASSSKPQGPTS